jgi:hypothetical protein
VDPISIEALNSLNTAVQSLLPTVADPAQQPQVAIQPQSITPTGLGGFVGMNDAPIGEIHGRRIDALVVIGVKATADSLNAQVAAVTNAFLAADRATLLGQGFQRVAFDKLGDPIVLSASLLQRPVSFRVLFEFLKKPTDPEGVIQQIPLNIQLQQS